MDGDDDGREELERLLDKPQHRWHELDPALNLSRRQLRSMPPVVGQLRQLTQLDLHGNELKSIPSAVGQLRELTHLYLFDNQLQSIPSELGQPF